MFGFFQIAITALLIFMGFSVIYCATYMVRTKKGHKWFWIIIASVLTLQLLSYTFMLYGIGLKILYHFTNIYVFLFLLGLWLLATVYVLDKAEKSNEDQKKQDEKKA